MPTASTSPSSRRKRSKSSSSSLARQLPSLDQIRAEKIRRSLSDFIREAWPIVEPGTPLIWGWHLDAICEHLEAVSAGQITRLVMNIPPRGMKSLTTAVFWPAWEWLTGPEQTWLYASHSEGIALRDARRARRLMASEGVMGKDEGTLVERFGYQGLLKLLGNEWLFTSDENVMKRYSNDRMGYRISTGIGGGATGEGATRVVIDDPHKLEEADSEPKREEAVEFVTEIVPTRLNSADAATVLIMQRVHEADATGAVLQERGWTHLCLPMEYEPSHPFVWPEDPRTEPAELLAPERFPRERVDSLRVSLGSYKYAGQYQQRPSPDEGGILQRAWWRYYTEPPQMQEVIESWDMAFKDKADSDYVVGQVWGRDLANYFLLAQIRARLDFPATKEAVKAVAEWTQKRWPSICGARLVEDKANGTAVIAELRSTISGLIAIEPEGGKEARAHAVSPRIEAGNVFLPHGAIPCPVGVLIVGERRIAIEQTRTEELVDEAAGFPNAANDDQIDAMTQALNRLRQTASSFHAPRGV